MNRRAALVMIVTCVAILAWPMRGDPPERKPREPALFGPHPERPGPRRDAPRPDPAEAMRHLQAGIRLQAQIVEAMENPALAGQFAVGRIKEIAQRSRKYDAGIEALRHIAETASAPALRRSALFAASELLQAADQPAEAIEVLVPIARRAPREGADRPGREGCQCQRRPDCRCRQGRRADCECPRSEECRCARRGGAEALGPRPAPHDRVADEARRVARWLREHPDLARRIIREVMAPHEPDRPDLGAPPRPEPAPERREDRMAETRGRLERQLEQVREMARHLERLEREIAEKAEHVERRHRELERWAERLQRVRQDQRRRQDDDED